VRGFLFVENLAESENLVFVENLRIETKAIVAWAGIEPAT
jgi:hypothetical protein